LNAPAGATLAAPKAADCVSPLVCAGIVLSGLPAAGAISTGYSNGFFALTTSAAV